MGRPVEPERRRRHRPLLAVRREPGARPRAVSRLLHGVPSGFAPRTRPARVARLALRRLVPRDRVSVRRREPGVSRRDPRPHRASAAALDRAARCRGGRSRLSRPNHAQQLRLLADAPDDRSRRRARLRPSPYRLCPSRRGHRGEALSCRAAPGRAHLRHPAIRLRCLARAARGVRRDDRRDLPAVRSARSRRPALQPADAASTRPAAREPRCVAARGGAPSRSLPSELHAAPRLRAARRTAGFRRRHAVHRRDARGGRTRRLALLAHRRGSGGLRLRRRGDRRGNRDLCEGAVAAVLDLARPTRRRDRASFEDRSGVADHRRLG